MSKANIMWAIIAGVFAFLFWMTADRYVTVQEDIATADCFIKYYTASSTVLGLDKERLYNVCDFLETGDHRDIDVVWPVTPPPHYQNP